MAVTITEQTRGQHGSRQHEQIDRGEPLQIRLGCVKSLRERWQRDAEHGAVQTHGENGQTHRT